MTGPAWANGLRLQIVVFLTLALLPLGAIAIYQTSKVEAQADRNAELARLALTERAARSGEMILERAGGVVQFVAAVASEFIQNPDHCSTDLSAFIGGNPAFDFIGLVAPDGSLICGSSTLDVEFSAWSDFSEIAERRDPTLLLRPAVTDRATSAFVLLEPVFDASGFAGFVALVIPLDGLPQASAHLTETGLIRLLPFNARGDVLASGSDGAAQRDELPANRALEDLETSESFVFTDVNAGGVPRVYTVVPIKGSPAAIMGVWQADDRLAQFADRFLKPAILPALMWVTSMGVALLSIYALVLRHLSKIRRNMEVFSRYRRIDEDWSHTAMPQELRALALNFDRLTDDILREEAQLEDSLREKNVLIKEVHHRVKNNLQLIVSIMNMHIRSAAQTETKTVLSRVQDRVLSLATIHRNLYQTDKGGRIDGGSLVAEVVEQCAGMDKLAQQPAQVETRIDPVMLFPDQAVPLSLLAAEAMTHAVRNLNAAGRQNAMIRVALAQNVQECTLTITHPTAPAVPAADADLGGELMNAFSLQLGAQLRTDKCADSSSFIVAFTVADFTPETRDY